MRIYVKMDKKSIEKVKALLDQNWCCYEFDL